jgi:ATP-dependent DNA ligase
MDSDHALHTEYTAVWSDEEVITIHDEWVEEAYEGAMLKDLQGTYQPGQRSPFWQKVKMFDDTEFEITGGKVDKVDLLAASEPSMYDINDTRIIDSFTFTCVTKAGDEFDVKPMGTREKRLDYLVNLLKYTGKMYTVKHKGYTKYGIPFIPTGKAIRDHE